MYKESSENIICTIQGCSARAAEGTEPPVCHMHMGEKTASAGEPQLGFHGTAWAAGQLFCEGKNVQEQLTEQ